MAKIRVYSRFESPIEFNFGGGYRKTAGGLEVVPCPDSEKVVLNGTSEVVNHTLILKEGALTIFGYNEHNLKERKYTREDFEKLKENSLFKQMLKNGDVSIDTLDDLSKDFTGVGKLSAAELQKRMDASKAANDSTVRLTRDMD